MQRKPIVRVCRGATCDRRAAFALVIGVFSAACGADVEQRSMWDLEGRSLEVTPLHGIPEQATLRAVIAGRDVEIVLERNTHLVSERFTTYRWNDGQLVPTALPSLHASHCYYLGHLTAPDDPTLSQRSWVAVSTCGSAPLEGALAVDGRVYRLDTTRRPIELRRVHAEVGTCGLEGGDAVPFEPPGVPGAPQGDGLGLDGWTSPRPARSALTSMPDYVEALIVTDAAWSTSGDTLADILAASNHSAALFRNSSFSPTVFSVLLGVVYNTADPYTVPPDNDSQELLEAFQPWENGVIEPARDVTVLLTGLDLRDAVVGIASVGSACRSDRGLVVQRMPSDPVVTGVTLAHEIGHTVGMQHDANANPCSAVGFVMQAVGHSATAFSSCSVGYYDDWRSSLPNNCVNSLTPAIDPAVATCGDGVRNANEDCDCGSADCTALDPCCDGATCLYKAGAICAANEGCCDLTTCAPEPIGTECRPSRGPCDPAEHCQGLGACPADRFEPAGSPCAGGQCFAERCVLPSDSCDALGDPDIWYDPACDPTPACNAMRCGRHSGGCLTVTKAPLDGHPCGDEHMCYHKACAPVSSVPLADGCVDRQADMDRDGVGDCDDACPLDAFKTKPLQCGCGFTEASCQPPVGGTSGGGGVGGGGNGASAGSGGKGGASGEPGAGNPAGGCAAAQGPRGWLGWLLTLGVVVRRKRRGGQRVGFD